MKNVLSVIDISLQMYFYYFYINTHLTRQHTEKSYKRETRQTYIARITKAWCV